MKLSALGQLTVWHFTRAELRALLACMSKDETRFGLWGMQLDNRSGGWCGVTDGHRGVMVKTSNRDLEGSIDLKCFVSREHLEHAAKIAKHGSWITICPGGGKVKISVDSSTFEGSLVDATLPPLEVVMPKYDQFEQYEKSCGSQCFNGAYLADIGLICDACPPTIVPKRRGKIDKIYSSVRFYLGPTDLDPMLAVVKCEANQTDWRVCLMPVKL